MNTRYFYVKANIINSFKKYVFYGVSILFNRGLEYIILLMAPLYLTKEVLGEFEFIKRLIELGAVFFTFGFPTLILSNTKSLDSKKYYTLISFILILFLLIISIPFLFYFDYLFLLVPLCFYAIFFNVGIVPTFTLVFKGSNYASWYKIIVSFLFYSIVFGSLFLLPDPEYSYVYVTYILLPPFLIGFLYFFYRSELLKLKLIKYWKLFRRLIISSFSIVISNFVNITFLYMDILIIKLLSENENVEIADYSFSLNISNALLLIPLTLVQVDIEKLKNDNSHDTILNKRIIYLSLLVTLLLFLFFLLLTNTLYNTFESTLVIFTIIIVSKFFQSISILYGAKVIIKKLYKENLYINISALCLNFTLSYLFYKSSGLTGVAIASLISLILRYAILRYINKLKVQAV
jgi:O-antigen/teichoic acid export membrane protein